MTMTKGQKNRFVEKILLQNKQCIQKTASLFLIQKENLILLG